MKKRQKFRLDLIGDVIEKTAELTLGDEGGLPRGVSLILLYMSF